MSQKQEKLRNLIAFCILMENGKGILDKSPNYVKEKFMRYIEKPRGCAYNYGLDSNNVKKLQKYFDVWKWDSKL